VCPLRNQSRIVTAGLQKPPRHSEAARVAMPNPDSSMQQHEEAFCSLLDAVSDYLNLREQLDQLLKAGHLKIARARYAMGPGSVGQTHYSSSMQATAIVDIVSESDQAFQLMRKRSKAQSPAEASQRSTTPQHQEDRLTVHSSSGADAALDTSDDPQTAHTEQSLGRETPSEYSSTAISELAAKFDKAHVETATSSYKSSAQSDPLKWFGFMVSPHLRQAQTDFVKAAELSVQLASVQYRMAVSVNSLKECEHTASL